MASLHNDTDKKIMQGRALILGGSRSIGRAVAIEVAGRGMHVIVHGGSSRHNLELTIEEIRAKGGSAEGFLHQFAGVEEFVERAVQFKDIALLVVALGPLITGTLSAMRPKDWEATTLFNLALPGALASAFLPAMRSVGFGRMLFFGGTRTDHIRGYKTIAAYSAAKTGLAVLTKSLAMEASDFDFGSITVCPGPIAESEGTSPGFAHYKRATAEMVAQSALSILMPSPCLASGATISMDRGFDTSP